MMSRLQGDCEDHTILLSSLFKAAGIQTRLGLVKQGKRPHIFPEISPPISDGELTAELLNSFYSKKLNENIGKVNWEIDKNGNNWFISDGTMSNYIGDLSGLDRSGYINDSLANGGWEFKEIEYIYI